MSPTTTVRADDRDGQPDSADRGLPDVGRRKAGSRIWYILAVGVVIALVVALASMAALNRLRNRSQGDAQPRTETVAADTHDLTPEAFDKAAAAASPPVTPPTPAPAAAAPVQPAAPTAPPALTPEQRKALDRAERRKRAPVVAVAASLDAPGGAARDGAGAGNARGSLGTALQATRAGAVTATLLADPNLTVTQGRLLPCVLETPISSDLPGMASCVLTRDVYSTNGRVLLLERGSRLVGQYQSGQMRRGMSRIFVLWTRAETPQGVLISLDSPAADALGRSGIDGRIHKHFWERFGAALLVSVVDDLGNYAVAKETEGASASASSGLSSTENVVNSIVSSSANIPPTLDKAQGASIGIFVARDLYFGDVYTLQPRDVSP